MTANVWELTGAAAKLFSLLGMAGVSGGGFSLWLAHRLGFARQPELLTYLLSGALAGLLATLLFFLLQVGAINRNGIAGMLDPTMIAIFAQSSLGSATFWRMAGFCAALPAWYLLQSYHNTSADQQYFLKAGFAILSAAVACTAISFAISGHTSTLEPYARIVIVLHVLAVFLWTGSLYPLLKLGDEPDVARVQRLMHVFGTSAMLIVAVVIGAGVFLLTRLLHSFRELLTTPYGLALLCKLSGVCVLLALAALNKLLLVPRLVSSAAVARLQASIRMELGMAFVVLVATVYLTTATGPPRA